MALPRLPKDTVQYKNKWVKKATLRPFTVGEQKIMLQYKDAKTPQEVFEALYKIMSLCVTGVDVATLPVFVVEEMFLRIREKAVGDKIDVGYVCKADVEGKECGGKIPFQIDLTKFKLTEPEGYTNKIMLADDIGVVMKELPLSFYMEKDTDITDDEVMLSCIDAIFEGDDVTMAIDVSREELAEFYDGLSPAMKFKIEEAFVNKKPHIYLGEKLVCPKCGEVHEIEFNNLSDVFL
jgi:hypothetical protein